jgi:hypothetical protein
MSEHWAICPECGFPIGMVINFVSLAMSARNLKINREQKIHNTIPRVLIEKEAYIDIFKAIESQYHLSECCRVHLMASVIVDDNYVLSVTPTPALISGGRERATR